MPKWNPFNVAHELEETLLERIPKMPLLSFAFGVGIVYVAAIAAASAFSLSADPGTVLVYGAGIIGVGAFLIALPALGYAIRTDETARSIRESMRAAERELPIASREKEPISGVSATSAVAEGIAPAPTVNPLASLSAGGTEYELISPKDVPSRVLVDLLSEGEQDSPLSAGDVMTKLEYVAREPGQGNKPWLFGFNGLDELWRITYGGRGKISPTVTRLNVPSDDTSP